MRVVLPALVALLATSSVAAAQPASPRLQGIIGQWGPYADAEPALRVDGASWDGAVSRDAVTAAGKALFGDASAS
ncbi:MAG: hypothetical protein JNJ98_13130, partial [Gemmatimonadetes bacterium]|nr:hypothetical protein [Gemmatimonadota bacterium]